MWEQYIIYGIIFYFVGLFLSGLLVLFQKKFQNATKLFVLANVVGFTVGIIYFTQFSGQHIILMDVEWFFHFAPQLHAISAVFFTVLCGVSALVGVYSLQYLSLYKETYNPSMVASLMAFFVLGMQGVLISHETFSFLFFWEVMSFSSFFLVLSDRKSESIKAAFLYLIMTHIGASAILAGFLILGKGSLSFDFDQIQNASQNLSVVSQYFVFLLFLFGFGSKAGLVPFHVWLPEAHPQAPSNISALMSGLMLKVAVYGFIMIMLEMYHIPRFAALIVIFLGLLSGLVGVLYAVIERDIKRVLAYSSIENMGIIFAMLGLAMYYLSQNVHEVIAYGLIAFTMFHAINHALFKTALFLSSGVIINRVHTKSLDAMGGIAKVMPIFSFGFLIVILGSLPLPPFGTFYGEWGFIQSVISLLRSLHDAPYDIILLLSTLVAIGLIGGLGIFAMIRIFGISMLGLPHHSIDKRSEKTDILLIVPIIILGMTVLVLGIFAQPIILQISVYIQSFATASNISPQPMNITSIFVAVIVFAIGSLVYMINKIVLKNHKERKYHTWDCGQPIDVSMQYSATAFSAPIRFFFLTFIGREKTIRSEAIVETNPWIRKSFFALYLRPIWIDVLYAPITKGLFIVAERVRLIQSGRIQYYILFLLFALIITLITAL